MCMIKNLVIYINFTFDFLGLDVRLFLKLANFANELIRLVVFKPFRHAQFVLYHI
jgi:hypothetical protein